VLSRDNLKISFQVHTVWRVDDQQIPLFMERFSTTVKEQNRDKALTRSSRLPTATSCASRCALSRVTKCRATVRGEGRAHRNRDAVLARVRAYAASSPFVVTSVVVGNVQYPGEVADAVSRKLAATQELQRKDTEIEIERKERTSARCRHKASPMPCRSSAGN